MCLKIYELDPAHILSTPGLAWQGALKLDLLTDIDIALIVEKDIKGEICPACYRSVKANDKYIKNYDKVKEPLYLEYCDVNKLYG